MAQDQATKRAKAKARRIARTLKRKAAAEAQKALKPVADMSTPELLAEYNQLTGKSVKKFSSRAAGEKQVTEARKSH